MKKANYKWLLLGFLILAAAVFFAACYIEPDVPPLPDEGEELPDPDRPEDGRIDGDFFTSMPNFRDLRTGTAIGTIVYRFTLAAPNNAGVNHSLHIAPGYITKIDDILNHDDVIVIQLNNNQNNNFVTLTRLDLSGEPVSAVVAAKNGEDTAFSRVRQGIFMVNMTFANPSEEDGTLISRGPATSPGITYYIDAERGHDNNDGLSPISAWRTFRNTNGRIFSLEIAYFWKRTVFGMGNLLHRKISGNCRPVGQLTTVSQCLPQGGMERLAIQ